MKKSMLQKRREEVAKLVREEIQWFLRGRAERECPSCGRKFEALHRAHFFCVTLCRKDWYRGQFRPRKAR